MDIFNFFSRDLSCFNVFHSALLIAQLVHVLLRTCASVLQLVVTSFVAKMDKEESDIEKYEIYFYCAVLSRVTFIM